MAAAPPVVAAGVGAVAETGSRGWAVKRAMNETSIPVARIRPMMKKAEKTRLS